MITSITRTGSALLLSILCVQSATAQEQLDAAPQQGPVIGLLDIYHEALASDPRLQVASARRDVFAARKEQSKGAMLPQIRSTVQNTRNIRESDNPIFGIKERDLYNGERYKIGRAHV